MTSAVREEVNCIPKVEEGKLKKDEVNHSSQDDKKRNRKCRRLFEKMRKCEKTRNKMFIRWKPLHELFVSNPLDYDAFKSTYEQYKIAMTKKADWNNYSPINIRIDDYNEKDNEEWQQITNKVQKKQTISKNPEPIPPQMLPIWIEINGVPTVAIVDSGGGATNITYSYAERAGLAAEIDTFYRSTCHGVHTVKTLGEIDSCKFEIGGATFESSVRIWTENEYDWDAVIGINFLRLHDCIIDLPNNRLIFGGSASVGFLTDDEALKWRRERQQNDSFEIIANKDKLDQIMDLGFKKDDAENALKEALNGLEEAISTLFHRALKNARTIENENPEIWELQSIVEEMNKESNWNLDEENELNCKQLFDEMTKPLTNRVIYNNWPALHSQYINLPADYEGFKKEYAKFLTMKKKLEEIMNDSSSSIGKALYMRKRKEEIFEKNKSESIEKIEKKGAPSEQFYIRIKVNDVATLALIDTGASTTFMPMSFIDDNDDELKNKIDNTIRKNYKGIGRNVLSNGKLACSFEIGKATFEADCTIYSGGRSVIIGLDFMRQYKCVIDCARNRITLMGSINVGMLPEGKISRWRYCFLPCEFKRTPPSFEIDKEKLDELIAMKFSKDDAVEALKLTLNDLHVAVSNLYYMEHDRKMTAELLKSSK